MKNVTLISLALLSLLLSNVVFAQTYTCTILNQSANGTDFSFDIYMQRTDATEIYLGQSEFSVTFNDGNFSSPTVDYVAGSDLGWYTVAVEIPSGYSNVVKFSVGALFFNNQSEFNARVCTPSNTAPGTLIATITISGISIPSGTAGILWRTTAPHDSKVNNYLNADPWTLTNITSNGIYTNPPDAPLPVELTSFTAEANGDKVDLSWETKTEVSNYGFDIERSIKSNEKEEPLWTAIGFIEGNGNSNSPHKYSFKDKNPYGGSKFVYRLKQIDTDGEYEYSDEVEVELLPTKYELYQNYPNPFNPVTNIKFSLPEDTRVSIKIYDVLGALVGEIVNTEYKAGYHKVEFNANNYASGIYIYRIETKNFIDIKKMLLLK